MREIHPYATDSSERDNMAIVIAVIAALVAWWLHNIVEAHQSSLPGWLWWVEVPGPIALYLLLRRATDEWAWSWPLLRFLRLVRIPNLNGKWNGTLRSSNDEMQTEHPCTLTIRQTWTRIAVVLTTKTSRSQNLVAGILINGADDALLVYEFENEPAMDAPATMSTFRGHATLRLERDERGDVLTGDYYSGRGRATTGTMTVRRAQPGRSA